MCPFDFNPDFLPGGYADDLYIVPMLFVLGAKLIPRVVLQDARKATAQAVCGILCLGLAVAPSTQKSEYSILQTGGTLVSHLYAGSEKNLETQAMTTMSNTLKPAPSISGKSLSPNKPCEPRLTLLDKLIFSKADIRSVMPASVNQVSSVTNSLLIARGGQFQLYGAEVDASDWDVHSIHLVVLQPDLLPSAFAGGFFVCNQVYSSNTQNCSVKKAPC